MIIVYYNQNKELNKYKTIKHYVKYRAKCTILRQQASGLRITNPL